MSIALTAHLDIAKGAQEHDLRLRDLYNYLFLVFLASLDAAGAFDRIVLFRISRTLMSTHLFPSSLNPSALANATRIADGRPDTRTSVTSCTGACVPLALDISALGTLAVTSLAL
ncbi:hypothetical protein F4604DRAFT_1915912 [Suillus subluteus]|nr:hypothetical protein F4604DRAFT_1915912 [Suillus subluteus]